MEHYDAVVIGAGIAGLFTAAYLAKAGARVMVCEQADRVGGLFNSFRREGYLFDGGIKALENAGLMLPALAQLGLLDGLHLIQSPVALITQDRLQPVRSFADVEAYFRHLQSLFPGQRAGLSQVLDDTHHVFDLLGALLGFPNLFPGEPRERGAIPAWAKGNRDALASAPRALRLMNTPLRRYVEQRIADPGLVNLLCGLFPDGTTAFFGLGYFRVFLDYWYPADGLGAIPQALAGAIRSWGGEIALNTLVTRVRLAGGRACGVVTADGRELNARYVVAAGDARRTFTLLLPPEAVPAPFRKTLLAAAPSHTAFHVFLGLDLPVERLSLQGCGHLFYMPDLQGITEADRLQREDYFLHVPQEISVPCLHQASLAPPGKTGLVLSAMAQWGYAGNWGLDDGRPGERYQQLRARFAREMIASLERFIPDVAQHIELCFTATPYTLQTSTLNSEGAIMGWSYDRRKTWYRGNFLQIERAVRSPVPRLLMAGHWSFSPGGSPVAALTARLAAERILKDKGE